MHALRKGGSAVVIELTAFLNAVSRATDYVEDRVLNLPRYHVKRVAVLTHRLAESAGLDGETVYALTQAAVLHDCALSEYLSDELSGDNCAPLELNMAAHCWTGERMLRKLPFYHLVEGAVLCHHDRADGQGAMRRTAEETPLGAQLIHIADRADVTFQLDGMDREKYRELMDWVAAQSGTMFSPECVRLFTENVDLALLESITGERCVDTLAALLPPKPTEVPVWLLREMCTIFADLTDLKSHFTWKHSQGVAEKAERLGFYYGYPKETCDKLYIAGVLHDIGKLLIRNDILEKPARLTDAEYKEITNHALGTWELLHRIGGMEEITRWAALHHEKLDGSGYPFGLRAEQLGKNERMLACIDVYQALVEERPYKRGMRHENAMHILRKMGRARQLDADIIEDIDTCYLLHSSSVDVHGRKPHMPEPDYPGAAWRCPVCGYVYLGTSPRDTICPQCKQPGSIFEQI